METIKLNNGVRMPLMGYGVYQVKPEETERCVLNAIQAGYRLIDTAQAYYNEEGVGEAISKCGVERKDLFITTKVWISNAGEERAYKSILDSLKKLKTNYIDLLLIHQPYGDYYGTWRAMERALKEGLVRAIGLSNFRPDRWIDFVKNMNVMPAVIQLETNVFSQQTEMRQLLKATDTHLMAWSPMARGRHDFFEHPVLTEIGQKYGKSAAQVGLRFLTQQHISVIPKSTHTERLVHNLESSDFMLSVEDMERIKGLNIEDGGTVQFTDPAFVNFILTAFG
jgi:Aldo/keto reductases, related to diketogulonate reductase